ncbi:MAG: acyl-CoA dehydrogenase [Candidatus Nanopelagicales bacterium]|nr:acyl-CoA dehydrogenase [Candidatus Nanopelagicales bacterium]
MSAMDWPLTPERRTVADSIQHMCSDADALTLMSDAGIPWIGIDEALGGSGGDLQDAATAIRSIAMQAHSAPIAEALVAGSALAQCAMQMPSGLLTPAFAADSTLVINDPSGSPTLTGIIHGVPAADCAEFIVVPADRWLCLVHTANASLEITDNIAHEHRSSVTFQETPVHSMAKLPSGVSHLDLYAQLAFARAIQLSGALNAVRDLSIEFAKTREQFGKPISSLQVIAHYLAELAELALVGEGAIATALEVPTSLNFAIAKSVTSRAARESSRIAHQIHGAMGMSQEYALGKFTTRMWAWVEEAGRPEFWNTYIGHTFLNQSHTDLWLSISDVIEGERT